MNSKKFFFKPMTEISIIIYCFEYKYLKKTIKSLLGQKYLNLEIIIIYDNDQKEDLK